MPPATASVTDDDLAASWHSLLARYSKLTCRLDRELGQAYGLSSSEFEVLQQLACSPQGKLRMIELAEGAHLSQSALSRLISRLEGQALVARTTCEADRRSIFCCLTDDGRRTYRKAKITQRAILREEAEGCTELLG